MKLYATLETSTGKKVSISDNEQIVATVYDRNLYEKVYFYTRNSFISQTKLVGRGCRESYFLYKKMFLYYLKIRDGHRPLQTLCIS